MQFSIQLIKLCLFTVVCSGLLLISAFVAYGLYHDHDVISGLKQLLSTSVYTNGKTSGEYQNDGRGLEKIHHQDVDNLQNTRISWVAELSDWDLNESSGLTASPGHADLLWSINDSGSEPILYGIDLLGNTRAKILVDTQHNTDWESLDSFSHNGKHFIVIGDIGDNFRWRKQVTIIVVEEPQTLDLQQKVTPAWQFSYRYPQGARDSEALTVDMQTQSILVLSKRHYPPELFSIPLLPQNLRSANLPSGTNETAEDHAIAADDNSTAPVNITASKITELIHIPQPSGFELSNNSNNKYRYMPSGMDLSGDQLIITTYKHGYLYNWQSLRNTPNDTFPLRVLLPSLGQREAITWAHGSSKLAFLSKERAGGKGDADIFAIELDVSTNIATRGGENIATRSRVEETHNPSVESSTIVERVDVQKP